ncbi:PLP-dependent aminotransferase family protein [Pullulanibacillus sp. KACC 23026]|uniref:MocR-like pyridoxine biosynthesis transcription factor PdxR n=1 Tax=Pullulanibacillus sp. KACC 23026 TaxID=3028315 RepID=UPI0023AF8C50|nr:PLP-dependent aminotransferase family protein [Pullulanibacillus sp. KACC 23026]WEG14710.1 PLP-dependent aminotransferase family protein [Pullulanibacillus sp. KACC 23026]
MDWRPNREDKKPIYKQIADYIELGITLGDFPAGSKLPSERQLADELEVNRSTVVAAYDELGAAGMVSRIKGSGTLVSADIWGISHKRIPNWGRYVEYGSFLPNLPLVQLIRKETQEETNRINLSSGELSPDLFPKKEIQTILAQIPFEAHLGYDHPQGNWQLRETITDHLKQTKQIETDPESILITSGAQQALHLIVECLLKPGDAVAIEDPSYFYSLPIFKSAGLRTFLLPVDKDGINPEDILDLHKKHRIRMVFVNPTYQNPTGTVLSLSRRKRLLELSSELGLPIIEDDPYSLTSFDGKLIPTLKSMDQNGTVLYISSLTKIVASGLRIGWVIGPKRVMERLADAKQQFDFGHSIFPQWVAYNFLQSPEFLLHIQNLQEQLKLRCDQLMDNLKLKAGHEVDFLAPEGGIHLWCRIHNEEINEKRLLEESLKNGVAYLPGSVMGSKKNTIRFTFGRGNLPDLTKGIERFTHALKSIRQD